MTDLKSTTLAAVPPPVISPELKKKRKLRVLVTGPNGGGVRKTKTALAIGSVAAAGGLTVVYVCADRGIGSLQVSLKEGGPNRVEYLPEEETGTYGETLLAIADEADADVIIIDLGANEMLNAKSRRTVRPALRQLKALGHDTFVVVSLVPGKVGLDEDAATFARQMSKDADIVLALHGQDEGGDLSQFDELIGDYPSINMPSDQLGILQLIAAAGVTPFDWCSMRVDGFELASAWTAHNLLQLARQPMMTRIAGGDLAVPVLAGLSEGRPVPFYLGRNTQWQVTDVCLAADAREITTERALLGLPIGSNDSAVLDAARAFIAAATAAQAAHQKARLAV